MMKHRKKQWKIMKTREKTPMKHDEKEKKNNEKWWQIETKQWKLMKNREKTMKTD